MYAIYPFKLRTKPGASEQEDLRPRLDQRSYCHDMRSGRLSRMLAGACEEQQSRGCDKTDMNGGPHEKLPCTGYTWT